MAPPTAIASSSSLGPGSMPSDLERGAMPLRDLPRLSTETQRRNGYVQSSATDMSTRIREDLDSGNYICSICTDNIVKNGEVLQSVYHCRDCYTIFHLSCIKLWAQQKMGRSALSCRTWPCPMCKAESDRMPRFSCYCGKSNTMSECASTCGQNGECPHGKSRRCSLICHPGPCDGLCDTSCENLPLYDANTPPSAWQKIRRRWRSAPLMPKKRLKFHGSLLLAFIILTQVYVYYYSRWNAMPYRYIEFVKKHSSAVYLSTIIISIFITTWLIVLSLTVFGIIEHLLSHTLNLMDPTTNRVRKSVTHLLMLAVLFVAGVLCSFSLVISLEEGPSQLFHNQMKDSCSGFDLRISMNGPSSNNLFKVSSTSTIHKIGTRQIYLAPHFSPVLRSPATPFQWYHRLTANSFNNTHIAVDVDVANRMWRLSHLNDTDTKNEWLAVGSNETDIHSVPFVPEFLPISEELISLGTFSDTDEVNKHMHIPELNLSISNHWYYRDDDVFKPFSRCFNTTGLSFAEENALLDSEWSSNRDTERMVMRTMRNYNHVLSPLQMCVREADFFGHKKDARWRFVMGVKEELFVPFAIMQALRSPGEIKLMEEAKVY